jgi:hypothetical protein
MKALVRFFAKISILGLAVSLITPIPSARSSEETVTKTFVVRDYQNNFVQDAFVRVWWSDPIKGEINSTTPIVQTDANGSASITVSKLLGNISYQVFPKSGDTLNAPPANSFLSTSISETIQIKFKQANFKVEVVNPNNVSVTASDEAIIGVPNGSGQGMTFSMVLRSGAFGVWIPQDLNTSTNYMLGLLQFVPFKVANRFSWRYGFKATGASGSQTYSVYEDVSMGTQVSPDSNNVYKIAYKAGNITGKIKDVNGNAITVPVGVRGFVTFNPEFSAPLNSGSSYNFNATTSSDATWFGRVEGPAGKYRVEVRFDNTLDFPSFVTFMWKNSSGGFSLNEAGPFTTAPHTLDLRIPGPANVKIKVKTPGLNSTALPASVNFFNNLNGSFITSFYSATGEYAGILPIGSYKASVTPNSSSYAPFDIFINVASGGVTVTQGGGTLTAVNGFYEISPLESNFKFRIVSDTSTSVIVPGTDITITKGTTGQGDFVTNKQFSGSDVDFYIADGTYTIKVGPGNKWNTYKEVLLPLVVSGTSITVTGASVDNGVQRLPIKTKNLLFKIVSAANSSTAIANAWIDYCKVDSLTSPTSYTDCRGEGVDSTGIGGADLAEGLYFLNVNPGGTSSDARQAFKVQVTGSTISTFQKSSDNSNATLDGNRYLLSGSLTNVQGALKLTDGTTNVSFSQNEGIDVQLQKWNTSGNYWEWTASAWRNVPSFGFTVPLTPAAKYRVMARPIGMPILATAVSAEFETNGTSFSVLGGATGVGTPPVSLTDLNVSMKSPNFKIKLVNPLDGDSLMKSGWISVFKKETNGNQIWIENLDMNSQSPGLAGIFLENGNYRLEVNPQSGNTLIAGLARANYDLSVDGGVPTLSLKSVNVPIESATQRFVIKPSRSNVSGQVVNQAGTGLGNSNGKWVNVNIQKWQASGQYWEWTPNWGNVDKDGFFNMSVSEAGKYRLRIEPFGYGEATTSYSNEFTIAVGQESAFAIDFGPIKMVAPTLKVQVLGLNSTTVLQHIGIEIRKAGQFVDWSGTGQLGTATISFADAGSYELVVHPNAEQVNLGASRKTYSVTAEKGSDGLISATITDVSPTNGIHALTFASATLKGSVYQPGTTTGVANSQIVPVDAVTLRERWEYSTNSNNLGKWSISLPAGSYKLYARAPWGSSTYGNSAYISDITVASNGTATVTGLDPAALNIELAAPRWTGTIRTPSGVTDAVIPFATICLYTNNIWSCSNANENGAWAMSAPSGYNTSLTNSTAFSDNAILEMRDDRNREYPMLRFVGATAVFNAIGVGGTGVAATHRLNKSNFKIKVTGGGNNASNVWVSAETNNVGWLGGASTNSSGVASLYIDTSTVTQDIRVRVEVSGNREFSNGYSTTTKTFTIAAVNAANGSFEGTVELDTPNFRGVLREPTVNGVAGANVPWSWVQLFDESSGNWLSGTNTNESGVFTMNIPKAAAGETREYTVLVQPRWDSSGDSSKRQYTVIMDANGIQSNSDASKKVSIKGTTTPTLVTSINSTDHFVLTLAAPNIKGTVVNPSSTGVQDSWVVPINSTTGEHLWQQGMHSTRVGNFAMTLLDGSYRIEANVPWNTSDLAKAAPCSVTVANGVLATAANGGCIQANGTLRLALRAPNVTFTLKNAGEPVAYAWISLSVGNWWTNASSNKDGKVSLFIDRSAILAANPNLATGTHDIRVWVDPPHGSSNLVRWDCNSGDNKPLCSSLVDFNTANDYSIINPFDVTMPQPNTKLRVTDGTDGVANSWVSLFKFESNGSTPGPLSWIGGANTDSIGWASFDVDTSTATVNTRYRVEVNPPWDKKAIYSQKWYGNDNNGLTLAQVKDQTFTVGTPNLKLTVLSPQAVANKWGWIGLIEVDSNNNWVNWIGGFGLDNSGIAAVTLEANKRYRIDSHPANGRPGARTECYIQTDASSVVSKIGSLCSAGSVPSLSGSLNSMTITLNAGNLIGTVKDPSGNAVAGAIVYINETGATDESKAQTVTTDSSGKFGFTVDASKNWAIKIFPSGTVLAIKSVTNISFSGSTKDLGDVALGLKS